MATSDVFSGFEVVEELQGGVQLVYGVNVVQIEAEVKVAAAAGETIGQLVEKHRAALNIAPEAVVFVDGQKVGLDQTVPAESRRIEVVRPSGAKGASLAATPTIPLDDADAIRIRVLRRDTINYQLTAEVVQGTIDEDLLYLIQLKTGVEILRRKEGKAFLGHIARQIRAVRIAYAIVSEIRRRMQAGVAATGSRPVSINDMRAEYPRALEFRLNGEVCPGGYCRELQVGELLEIVVPGETRTEDFETWAEEQRRLAVVAYGSALVDRDQAMKARRAELEAMNWLKLRATAAKAKIKVAGNGRTSEAIINDLLAAGFSPLPAEAEFVKAWLTEHAPEVLEA